jgi:hypothetical protein
MNTWLFPGVGQDEKRAWKHAKKCQPESSSSRRTHAAVFSLHPDHNYIIKNTHFLSQHPKINSVEKKTARHPSGRFEENRLLKTHFQ